ncbi:molybdopterin molybdenumtransferase [Williamsia phyllosphaerae]|uniref:Molybdopterin molybdenumtransferase n=1 Tax=Williamsia phyllosphaerae TaxID=885042 RepID=A0ABQ1U6Z0_9NOCA|nr:molybdopterin molybdenumtransferase [Williamsia phyllosphaerae]
MTAPLRSVSDHQAHVAALFGPARTVRVPIADALGRALAVDVAAQVSLPGFDNSAMDGYAVRAADIADASAEEPVRLPVAEDIPAGRTDSLTLTEGTVHRIMTGAPMPAGADAVVQVELTDGGDQTVTIHGSVGVGTAVRRAGSDIEAGEAALLTGTVIGSSQIGLLAALGVAEVEVTAPLHVVVLSTGSELIAPGNPLEHGQIYESNGAMLCAAVRSAGGEATLVHFVPDDVGQFRARLDEMIDGPAAVDLILTSGGVSAGAYEVVKDALTGQGVDFLKVAMQPGMPQGSGRYTSATGTTVPIVTLPGNPVSAQVSFEIFVRPPLRSAMGLPAHRRRIQAALADDLRSPRGKRQFRRGVFTHAGGADGIGSVIPIGPPSSHHLRFLASANALIDIAADADDVSAGTTVEVILLD